MDFQFHCTEFGLMKNEMLNRTEIKTKSMVFKQKCDSSFDEEEYKGTSVLESFRKEDSEGLPQLTAT